MTDLEVPMGYPVPKYVIDLGLEPRKRWTEIGIVFKKEMRGLMDEIFAPYPILREIVDAIGKFPQKHLEYPYGDELEGLAEASGINIAELFVFNIAYCLVAYSTLCTSIVGETKDGKIFHARNLDFSWKLLRKTTFTALFMRAGKTVGTATMNAGMIGILTGERPNAFTITINLRNCGSLLQNLKRLIIYHASSSVPFLIRNALEREDTYEGAVEYMTHVQMLAPCYIIIAGTKPGQGTVITRNRDDAHNIWALSAKEWFLLQTNHDHEQEKPAEGEEFSFERREVGNKKMEEYGQANLNPQNLVNVLSTKPVFNIGTIYTTVMSAADPTLFESWVRDTT